MINRSSPAARRSVVRAALPGPQAGWVVMRDPPDYPDKIVARLVTDRPTPYVLIAESLAELQAQLPLGLVRVERQPADLPEVVEIWFPA
jgi:hypothetical protein